jgi:hypothetical protein
LGSSVSRGHEGRGATDQDEREERPEAKVCETRNETEQVVGKRREEEENEEPGDTCFSYDALVA